jgi:hypothetical protein
MATSQLVILCTISLPHFEQKVFNNGQIVCRMNNGHCGCSNQSLPVCKETPSVIYDTILGLYPPLHLLENWMERVIVSTIK